MSVCWRCGAPVQPTAKFCGVCAAPLTASSPVAPHSGIPQQGAPPPEQVSPAQPLFGVPLSAQPLPAQPSPAQSLSVQPSPVQPAFGHPSMPAGQPMPPQSSSPSPSPLQSPVGQSSFAQPSPVSVPPVFGGQPVPGPPPGKLPPFFAPQIGFSASASVAPANSPSAAQSPIQQYGDQRAFPGVPYGAAVAQMDESEAVDRIDDSSDRVQLGAFSEQQQMSAAAGGLVQPAVLQPSAAPAAVVRERDDHVVAYAPTAVVSDGVRELRGFLISFAGRPEGEFWPFYSGQNSIGRQDSGEELDIMINDPTTSSRHAVLTCDLPGRANLRDEGSTNGTIVNGHPLGYQGSMDVRDGDKICLGGFIVSILFVKR